VASGDEVVLEVGLGGISASTFRAVQVALVTLVLQHTTFRLEGPRVAHGADHNNVFQVDLMLVERSTTRERFGACRTSEMLHALLVILQGHSSRKCSGARTTCESGSEGSKKGFKCRGVSGEPYLSSLFGGALFFSYNS